MEVEHFFKSLNTEVFNYWDLIKKYNLDKLFKNDKMYSCEKAIHKLEILKDYIMPDEFDRCIKVLEKQIKKQKRKTLWNKILIGVGTVGGFYLGTQL